MFYNPHKKISFFFLFLTILLFVLTFVFFFVKEAKMIISVSPRLEKSLLEKTVKIPLDLRGEILEISLEEEKMFHPEARLDVETIAGGEIEIINNTNQSFNFVKTTRFLTLNNLLFRLENQTFVPAQGKTKAMVYADKMGSEFEIGPTRFTIPGLSANLQTQVYAESKEKMKGGIKKIGFITDKDISEAKKNIEETINQKAEILTQEKIKEKGITLTDWKMILGDKRISLESDAKAGEEKGEFQIKGKINLSFIIFNEKDLSELIKKLAQENMPEDKKLINIETETLKYDLKKINLTEKTAELDINIRISSIIKENFHIFDFEKIKKMESKEIKNFLEQYREIEEIKIRFNPFWKRKTPTRNELIKINIYEPKQK